SGQGRDRAARDPLAPARPPLRRRRSQSGAGPSAPRPGIGMIRYALHCDRAHEFESWFQSSSAYDSQVKRKLVTCPICGSAKVDKAIMAPRIVRKKGGEGAAPEPAPAPTTEVAEQQPTSLMMAQEHELRAKLKELRDH